MKANKSKIVFGNVLMDIIPNNTHISKTKYVLHVIKKPKVVKLVIMMVLVIDVIK